MRTYVELPDGTYAYGPLEKEYSVRKYCENQLGKSTIKDTLKNICASVLHYGAAAQVHFSYNTEDPANANILETYPAAEWNAELLDALDSYTSQLPVSASVTNYGKALSLDGLIFVNYYFKFAESTDNVAKAEMLVWRGVEGELTEENTTEEPKELKFTEVYDGKREFAACTDGIPAKEYGDTVYACAKFTDAEGNVTYSKVTAYSVETYAKNTIGNAGRAESLKELCRRMVVYGEAAKTHFGG